MQITIDARNQEDELFIPLDDVSPESTVKDLKAVLEPLIGVAAGDQTLIFNGSVLSDESLSLERAGIKNEDMISVRKVQPESSGKRQRTDPTAEGLRLQLLQDERLREEVQAHEPELVELRNDPVRFAECYMNIARAKREEKERALHMLHDESASLDPEAQRKIEEMINEERWQKNIDKVYETAPELLASVTMLYIPVLLNGIPVKAFVDSGAQITIVSPECAEKCNIGYMVDKRAKGKVQGVGEAAILGRAFGVDIQIGNNFMDCAFTVVEGSSMDMLLGLDMLKRYQACVDLKKSVLRIGNDEVPFLPESEIPNKNPLPSVPGPSGKPMAIDPEKGKAQESGTTLKTSFRQTQQPAVATQPATGSTTAAGPSTASPSTAEKIQQLMQMGFPEQEARQALEIAEGNIDLAAAYLFPG